MQNVCSFLEISPNTCDIFHAFFLDIDFTSIDLFNVLSLKLFQRFAGTKRSGIEYTAPMEIISGAWISSGEDNTQ